jgi:hypothetical protein
MTVVVHMSYSGLTVLGKILCYGTPGSIVFEPPHQRFQQISVSVRLIDLPFQR